MYLEDACMGEGRGEGGSKFYKVPADSRGDHSVPGGTSETHSYYATTQRPFRSAFS